MGRAVALAESDPRGSEAVLHHLAPQRARVTDTRRRCEVDQGSDRDTWWPGDPEHVARGGGESGSPTY
eukprot:13304903-Alexandrium_andersonii.AAC.1